MTEILIDSEADTELGRECKNSANTNQPHVFHDIIDEKHHRYMNQFIDSTTLFWGLGIENESYLMLKKRCVAKDFKKLKLKSERYSVNYFNNFKSDPLVSTIKKLYELDQLTYPVYINAHTLHKTDIHLEHRTLYSEIPSANPIFTESLHDKLLRENTFYQKAYDHSIVFDGDSIEFITQDFYNATVSTCIHELITVKQQFLAEVSPLFKDIGSIQFPDHNYGITTFLTTHRQHLALCNNGTYHINITLPTLLHEGVIVNKPAFIHQHLQLVNAIQIVEPLLVACYGTPDVFSLTDPTNPLQYSIGSLRITLSRYISLQTFDTEHPVNGKLLLMKKLSDSNRWYNQLQDSPYQLNQEIGADINFNKFKNHGIEMRFLDWFPEMYLAGLMNFIVLLAQHSVSLGTISFSPLLYQSLIKSCVQKGFTYLLPVHESHRITEDLHIKSLSKPVTAHELLLHISNTLYHKYHDAPIVQQMSPHMERPVLVNYNRIAFQQLHRDMYGMPRLIIRAEENAAETRSTIVPDHIPFLKSYFHVLVESSSVRCFTDEEYRLKGATIVDKHTWKTLQDSYVIGLKGIENKFQPFGKGIENKFQPFGKGIYEAKPRQTHMYFAHCFKGQPQSKTILQSLAHSVFIDYEYMVDTDYKRAISFCSQSGKIGCYLALMAYYKRLQKGTKHDTILPEFNEAAYLCELKQLTMYHKPTVLLIGYGTVGKRCKSILDQLGIECTIWRSTDDKPKEVILRHNILLHAVSLSTVRHDPPILVPQDLCGMKHVRKPHDWYDPAQLSVICDISCDLGNPRDLLPIYDSYTTKENPVISLPYCPSIDFIAIPHLPSLEPIVSSTEFSKILITFLPALLYFHYSHLICDKAHILYQAYQVFLTHIKEL